MSLLDFDNEHIWHPYASLPNEVKPHLVKSAKGVYLTLADDIKVIDGMSSWWSAIHGYNHPKLNKAITKQVKKMSHVMFGGLTHKPAIKLVKTLIKITPSNLDKVFFADSGSVAVEVAIKMALQYFIAKNKPQKNKLLTIKGGYYGDTFGAMALCDPINGMHHLFNEILAKHYFVSRPKPYDNDKDLKELENTVINNHQNIAAIILEPILQGAGGMWIYRNEYLKKARELCDKYDILLIVDEIATGFGRTGKLFAVEHANITPDILCLGKAITGGYLSFAATICSKKISDTVGLLMHGPTFMANPLACSIANKSIKLLLKSNWQQKIQTIEKILIDELIPLKKHPKVKDIRIIGAVGVVEMKDKIEVETTQKTLIQNGVWLRPFGKLLYTMPPYIIKKQELLTITNAIKKTL